MQKKWVVIAIIVLAGSWYVYKNYYASRNTQVISAPEQQAPLPPLTRATDNTTIFGTMVIYDPTVPNSPLKNHGFIPQTWYLIPKEVDQKKGITTPSLDYQIGFDADSVCTVLSNQNIRWNCTDKAQTIPWGYGESVKIEGLKNNKLINVSSMTLVND